MYDKTGIKKVLIGRKPCKPKEPLKPNDLNIKTHIQKSHCDKIDSFNAPTLLMDLVKYVEKAGGNLETARIVQSGLYSERIPYILFSSTHEVSSFEIEAKKLKHKNAMEDYENEMTEHRELMVEFDKLNKLWTDVEKVYRAKKLKKQIEDAQKELNNIHGA